MPKRLRHTVPWPKQPAFKRLHLRQSSRRDRPCPRIRAILSAKSVKYQKGIWPHLWRKATVQRLDPGVVARQLGAINGTGRSVGSPRQEQHHVGSRERRCRYDGGKTPFTPHVRVGAGVEVRSRDDGDGRVGRTPWDANQHDPVGHGDSDVGRVVNPDDAI